MHHHRSFSELICCTIAIASATALLVGGTTACSPILASRSESSLRSDGSFKLIDDVHVPEVRGQSGCGAQALAAAIALCDPETDADALAEQLPWHDLGATPVEILLEARKRNRSASIRRGEWEMLIARVRADRPTLIMFDAAPEARTILGPVTPKHVMHWAIATGCDFEGQTILLGAPNNRHHVVKRDEFLRRWNLADNCLIEIE